MATDLSSLIVTHVPGFWSWLVMVGSNVNLVAAQAFINLTWGLAVFLSVIILLEVAIVIYVGSKIDLFAKDTLNHIKLGYIYLFAAFFTVCCIRFVI